MSTLRTDAEDRAAGHRGEVLAERFVIDRLAGRGGMGAVYRAYDQQSDSWVALKLLHQPGPTGGQPERFLQEAQLLSELSHPNIVRYIAHGQTAHGHCYLAMQWLDGHDLAQRLRSGPLSVKEALTLATHIATALTLAHQKGIIHRDTRR
jgi:serine/threonine protein kinase